MEIYGYVYMVKNLINGKIYFGITENDFDTRYRGNIAINTSNEHLKSSIKKYGIENFEINKEFDIAYTEDDLYDLEDMYICLYNTLDRKYGYNKRRSGSKHKGSGKPSEETRRKQSEWQIGRKLTTEHRKHMSEARKGENNPMYNVHRYGEANPMYGKLGANNPNSKPIILLNTLEVFSCTREACEKYNIKSFGNVIECCNGNRKSAGKHPVTGERLHWMRYDKWLELNNENSDTKVEEIA